MSLLPAHAAGVAFLLYAGASLSWSLDPQYGLALLASLTVGFFIGRELPRIDVVWFFFILALIANAVFSVAMHAYAYGSSPYGLFGNPNYLGCGFALAIAACLAYRRWVLFIPAGFAGLAYTQSRTAIVAAGATCIVALPRWWKLAGVLGAAVCLLVAWRYRGGSAGESMWQRMGIWQDTVNHLTIFGTGFGSFADAYKAWPVKTNMTLMLTNHAYNDFLEMIFELGIGAIPLWIMLILSFERAAPERLILGTFLILSLTYFPLYIPVIGHLAALTLGHLARSPQWQDSAFAVRHTCDNPRCWNFLHLRGGSYADNIDDKVMKGRQALGEAHGHAKLTEEQVLAIRASDEYQAPLAVRYGVSTALIGRIKRNEIWTHL